MREVENIRGFLDFWKQHSPQADKKLFQSDFMRVVIEAFNLGTEVGAYDKRDDTYFMREKLKKILECEL